ncbi:hypothetical protein [Nesterenkonia sp. NBAIMH1]|uniref:hypothetical protein n=1 Tax=Nesterenkonia sp. NBAIMH1 TaxID=2600320 RepID=UPI00143CFD88|nr:hypothetical protein [Nesterenkonia sp. NBAIMH1]
MTAETLNDLQKDLAARSLRRIIAEGALTSEHRTFLLASLTQTADSELISGLLRVSPAKDARPFVGWRATGWASSTPTASSTWRRISAAACGRSQRRGSSPRTWRRLIGPSATGT